MVLGDQCLIGHQEQNGVCATCDRFDAAGNRTRHARGIFIVSNEETALLSACGEDSLPVISGDKDRVVSTNRFGQANGTPDQRLACIFRELLGRTEALAFAGREDDRKC